MNPLWQDETIRWGEKIKYEVNKSFTYVTGTINHLYHGKTSNRKYVERCTIVKDCNYDPYKDITIDSNDLLSWKHTNNELQTQLKSYFAHRLEDDNLSVNINEYFDGIFCINLKRKPDKWDVVNQRFKKNGINVTQILAYDGKFEIVKHQWDQVKVNIINKYGSTIFNDPNTLSNIGIIENEFAYGTLCSQIGIIQKAKAEKLKRILIFEDDVIFHKDFNNQLQQIKDLDWNLLYLGASQYDWDGITIKDGKYKAKKTLGCFAYAIDESIYDDILIAASTMEKSFDNILADQIQTTHDDCIVLYPNLVIADVRESELREPRDINEHGQRLHWDLSLYDV